MKKEILEREKRLFRLLLNLKKRKRNISIAEIACDIEWLKSELGSLKELALKVNISTEMLNRFLVYKELCPEVRRLIEERKIDSVEVANHISSFGERIQKQIARYIQEGKLTTVDVKVLRAFIRKRPNIDVSIPIKKILESKDKKAYILYIHIPNINPVVINKRLRKIIGSKEVISVEVKDNIGLLRITKAGLNILREASKNKGMDLRSFVNKIIIEHENK